MKAKTKRNAAKLGGLVVALALTTSLCSTSFIASAQNWYTDFDSQEEAWSAAEELNEEIAGEGMVLLKNDGTLPVAAGARVSVLGIAQDELVESSGSVAESLQNAGYRVNPTLMNFYANDGSTEDDYMYESELTQSAKNSIDLYSDVAVIVIGRGAAGEARDRSTNTGEVEDEKYLGEDTGWSHENHETSGTTSYKHELQLSESEEELIKLAKEKCDKIVILYSSANVFEMGNLQDDPDINAIMWIGRTGDGGIDAIGQVLNGTINPSGKVVDEWTRDFTNDPTYVNLNQNYFVNGTLTENDVNGDLPSTFAYYDYEEGIYLGYKYYETYWYEASLGNANATINGESVTADEWYDFNVVYPFGYGLSYTSFSFDLLKVTTDAGSALGTEVDAADLSSGAGGEAEIKTLSAQVAVTNTGKVAGKEVVQVYITVPYTQGETEKAYINLAGFAKTDTLQPGETQTVTVTFNVQDFASYDYNDANDDGHTGYELDAGTYTIHVMNSSSHENIGTDAYDSFEFEIVNGNAHLDLDDYSGNEISNKFSEENGDYDSMLLTEASSDTMTQLSRADFDGTQPTAPDDEVTLTKEAIETLNKYRSIDADDFGTEGYYDEDDYYTPYDAYLDAGNDGIPDTWTQGAGIVGENGMYAITLYDMANVSYDDAKWDTFLNQLSWDEIATLINYGYHGTLAVDTIGKLETSDENGPNHVYSQFYWCVEPTISATWNTELAERQGMMVGNMLLYLDCTGWYGPGMNIHRSQFSGRSAEYYSQDTLQSGYMAAAVVKGATSRGINVYVKHLGLYDQAPTNATYHGVNATEQVIRETYLTSFRMAMQEGGAHATMNEYGRIGAVYAGTNYNLLTGILRDEWGWDGFVVTDMIRYNETADGLIRAGGVLIDGDFVNGTSFISGTYTWGTYTEYDEDGNVVSTGYDRTGSKALSGEWDETLRDGNGAVTINGTQNNEQWYCARLAVKRLLYQLANSAATYNGITETAATCTVEATQGTAISATNILDDSYYEDHTITTEIVFGTLPEGMTLTDGVLSGTPLSSGSYEVTVDVTVDGWIHVTVTLDIEVDSLFIVSGGTSLNTGDSANITILVDVDGNYTLSICDGALPDGLSLSSDGKITGTAMTAGEYTFTVAAETANGTYYYTCTLTVSGDDVTVVTVTSVTLDNSGNIVVTFSDGTTSTLDISVEAGKTVADVTLGADGKTITITYTDDTSSTIVIDTASEEVVSDTGCGSVVNGLIGFAIAIPVLAGVVIFTRRRREEK